MLCTLTIERQTCQIDRSTVCIQKESVPAQNCHAQYPGVLMCTAFPTHASRRILIVEPHADTRTILQAFIEHYGHEVECASSTEAGPACAQLFKPHAVLIAIDYDDASGFLFCKQLRAMPETIGALIVGLSTYVVRRMTEVRDTGGFDQILLKPMDIQVILDAVKVRAEPA